VTAPDLLTVEQVREAVRRRQHEVAASAASGYRYVRPLAAAADSFISTVTNTDGRFMLGLADVDVMTRGFGRGELVYVAGRAHSGKTQVILNAIVNNPQAHVMVFSPDEVAELVLAKLVAIRHGINSETLEARIKSGDPEAEELVRRTARDDLANVLVIDDVLTLREMSDALAEAEQMWQAPTDCCVYDFLELLPGDDDGAQGLSNKSKAIKRWTKQHNVPMLCVHQSGKSNAPRGQSGGMDALRYGGDTEATFVLEVYRKRDNLSADAFERARQADTVTVNVAKNKRPPSKTGHVDLHMDSATGRIRHLRENDLNVETAETRRLKALGLAPRT